MKLVGLCHEVVSGTLATVWIGCLERQKRLFGESMELELPNRYGLDVRELVDLLARQACSHYLREAAPDIRPLFKVEIMRSFD